MKLINQISKISVNSSSFKDTSNGVKAMKSVLESSQRKAA